MIKKILQAEESHASVLRQIAQPIAPSAITTSATVTLLAAMHATLDATPDGVALAAPQIGKSVRVFIVSGQILPRRQKTRVENLVFINPVIKKISQRKKKMEEGCLSVRDVFGLTTRAEKVTVEAYNARGHKFIREGQGLLAQIFQHEIDHLDGILFIDKAVNLVKVTPPPTTTGAPKANGPEASKKSHDRK